MAINIKFDTAGNPEPPSIILATKNGNKLGQLNINADSIELKDKLKISEISFTLNKYIDEKLNNLWDKVVDFKLVWCKEWDCWFEIKVELDEATETVKTVFGTQLGQAELSQIMIYNMEVNTEEDIARDDYKITILYDENDHEASLLHRIFKDKAPHYSIAYVAPTIARIQRQFSWDGSSICDVLDEIEEEIGCLVVYNSNSTEGGMPNRSISVYDLEQNCNDCGYRGEFTDECPKCGSKNIKYGYGEDTTIFVTADELGSQGIQLVSDIDSVKNCFKLEAGDDLMTATIRNCNPNGSDYIWRFSNDIKEDMSDELVEKLKSYDAEYKRYYNEHESNLDATLLTQYNNLVDKYDDFYNTDSTCLNCDNKGKFYDKCPSCDSENLLTGKELQKISTPIIGYPSLMNAYYNTIDFALYLKSGLMPSITMSDTTAKEQASLLTTSSLSPVAVNVKEASSISPTTADSAVLSMAKVIVKSTYKVEILSSSLSTEKKWSGTFKIINYSDDTDTAEVIVNDIEVNNNTETFIKQKIEKTLNKENTDDYSISGLFEKEYDEFCIELQKYALNPLQSFYDASDACISILTEQGAGDETNKPDLYENLYLPYFQKQKAIASEISIRQNELAIIEGVYDETTKTTSGGLQNNIRNCQSVIQDALNFEDYLGEDLWKEFCSFRREDKYSNSNYISDGLNNAQLFERALEFLDVAENEIYKSSELQHSISTSLNNLLAIDKFKPLIKYFKNGNWIRVRVDDKIYKLRLLEYDISFGSFESIPVEFSNVTKIKNSTTDVQDVLKQASSVASSYDAVTRQAKKGNVAKSTIEQWIDEGLNAANVQIQSNDSEEIIITKNGLLGRSYDDITGTYSPEQVKLTHNIMAYTDDNWETVSSALGKHNYRRWNGSNFVDDEGYGLTSKFVTAGYITGSQIIGGEILSSNYESKTNGTYINLLNGDFDFAGGKIVYDSSDNEVKLKGVTIQWTGDDGVNAPEVKVENITGLEKYLDQLDALEDQLDGRVQTYSQIEDPSESWIEDEYTNHIGDLWINPDDGVTKRWTGSEWVIVTDSDLAELAQSKAQIFVSTPTPPYYVGDLWVQGSTGDILHCTNAKAEEESYDKSDWVKSSKYTDDTSLNTFISGDYADDLIAINNQIDGKARSWYQSTDPSETWDATENHEGDLWYNSSANSQVTYIYNNNAWQQTSVPKSLFDTIDGIASIYVTMPDNPVVGDLLIPATDIENYKAGKVYKYNGSSWNEIKYTDDTRADAAYSLADEAKGVADNAKTIGDNLVSGLGFQETEITGEYIISPVIAGGHLLIGDTSGTYAQIAKDGTLTATGVNISGHINATSLTLGEDKKTLSNVAISGDYNDLSNQPNIPTSVSDLGLDESTIIYKGDISQETKTDDNGINYLETTVPTVDGNITYSTYNVGDYIVFGGSKGSDSDGSNYYKVSKDGLLTARNAVIYGTIYATEGKIAGWDITKDGIEKKDEEDNPIVGMYSGDDSYDSLVDINTQSPIRFYAGEGSTSTKMEKTLTFTSTGETLTQTITLSEQEQDIYKVVGAECLTTTKLHGGSVSQTVTVTTGNLGLMDANGKYEYSGSATYNIVLPSWVLAEHITNPISSTNDAITATYEGNGQVKVVGTSERANAIVTAEITIEYSFTETLDVDITYDDTTVSVVFNPRIVGVEYDIDIGYNLNVQRAHYLVLEDGSLYASTAKINGTIYATDGKIGKCIINTDGSITSANGNFSVDALGDLYAQNANITGVITATTGYIGYQDDSNVGWTINPNKISGGGVSLYTGDDYIEGAGTDSEKKVRISVGVNDDLNTNPFRVFDDGYIVSANGSIGSCDFHEMRYPVVGEDLANISGYHITPTYEGVSLKLYLNYAVRYSPSDSYSVKTFTNYSYDSYTGSATEADSYTWYWAWTDNFTSTPSTWNNANAFQSMDTSVIKTTPHLWLRCLLQKVTVNSYGEYEYTDLGVAIYYIGDFTGYLTTFSFGDNSLMIGENIITGKTSSIKFEDDKGRLFGTWYYSDAEIATTSWRGAKTNIEELDNRYSILFDELRPVRFIYNNGQSNRYHTGLILDELKSAMDDANIDASELAAYCISDETTGAGGIRYSELIALCIDQIQKLKKRVEELEDKTKSA